MTLQGSTLRILVHGFIISILVVINFSAFSKEKLADRELLIATKCFIDNNSNFGGFKNINYKELAYNKSEGLVLFQVETKAWLSQLEKLNISKLPGTCGRFINVTTDWQSYLTQNDKIDYGYFFSNYIADQQNFIKNKIKFYQADSKGYINNNSGLIEDLTSKVEAEKIVGNLTSLTSFYNRAAHTEHGVKASEWINERLVELRKQVNKSEDEFSIRYLYNSSKYYKQPSVIAVLGKNLKGNALVVSAHLDTVSGRMPGADDDASGSVVVLETARVVLEHSYTYNRPIYFIWYSAEEAGLVGSKATVQDAIANKLQIDSVLHFDTIGRRGNSSDPTLWFLRDNVDLTFTDYLADLVKTYIKVPVDFTSCGYACSDHFNWTNGGFAAAAGFESSVEKINPYIHSAKDTIDKIQIENLVNFTKLALAYIGDRAG